MRLLARSITIALVLLTPTACSEDKPQVEVAVENSIDDEIAEIEAQIEATKNNPSLADRKREDDPPSLR